MSDFSIARKDALKKILGYLNTLSGNKYSVGFFCSFYLFKALWKRSRYKFKRPID